jgi:hypothetical protein
VTGQKIAGHERNAVQALYRRDERPCARSDQKAFRFQASISHLNRVAINEARSPLEYTDAIADDALIFLISVVADDLILLPNQLRKVYFDPRRLKARVAWMRRVVNDARRRDQIL